MKKITKAIIPAGGHGTRFLPASKSIPKEMFPIGDKPVIYHVVKEAVQSGITDIIFVVARHKHSVENFFSFDEMLEEYLNNRNKKEKVEELRDIAQMANFSFVFTQAPYGNGGAILSAQHLIEQDEPFAVVWADELMLASGEPRLKQCIEVYEQFEKPVISAVKIGEKEKRSRYGMAQLKDIGEKEIFEIERIVEKPAPGTEPSEYATHGAYILPYSVFEATKNTPKGKNDELWLTDILHTLREETPLLAKIIPDCMYLDCGDPQDYLQSQIEYALEYSPYAEELRDFLKKKIS